MTEPRPEPPKAHRIPEHEFYEVTLGVCKICGEGEVYYLHNPHEFKRDKNAKPEGSLTLCECGKTFGASLHKWKQKV